MNGAPLSSKNQSPGRLPGGLGFSFIGFFVSAVFLCFGQGKSRADSVIVNFPAALSTSTGFATSTGGSLSGNLVRIGAFDTDPSSLMAGVAALTTPSSVLSNLDSRFIQYTSFAFSNDYLLPDTGIVETSLAITPNLRGREIYLLFYNAASAGSATEVAIFRMKQDLLVDDPTGSTGIFNTAASLGQRTALFNLSVADTDLLLGFYNFEADKFETGDLNGGVDRILSPTNETVEAGDEATFFIRANHGANHFAIANLQVSTNGGVSFSNTTNTWITVATNAGELTLTPPANDTNRYRITLIASNTLTTVSASNTLQLTVIQPTGPDFGTSNNRLRLTAGVAFTTNLPATRAATFTNVGALPSWLNFSNSGTSTLVLSGTPPSIATNRVRFRAVDATNTNQTRSRQLRLVAEAPVLELPGLTEDGIADITVGTGSNTLISVSSPGFRIDEVTILEGDSAFGSGTLFVTNSTNLGFSSSLQPSAKTNTNGTRIVIQAVQSNSNGTISASREFRLRLAAPIPTRLLGTNFFEVDLGQAFETNILTDASPFALMQFADLPNGLQGNPNGAITGTANPAATNNRGTNLPYEFTVGVTANSSANYLGGGVFTSTLTIRLRNTNLPLFIPATNRILAGVGRPYLTPLNWSNYPFKFSADNLPPGLTLDGATIKGTPTTPGPFTVTVRATNSFYPGSRDTNHWRSGVGDMTIVIDGTPPPKNLSPASPGVLPQNTVITGMNYYLLPGGAEAAGVRMAAYGLPPGVTLNKNTGKLEGTTAGPGSYTATVFIANGLGWTKKTVTLTVQ